jgi:hypothetical protein
MEPIAEPTSLYTGKVIERLTPAEIVSILLAAPEQTVFDWKLDFQVPRDD